jgi:serine/threonine protein kinase
MSQDPFRLVGTTLDGRYRIDALLGEGGYGVVYAATHLVVGERVAVKCLRPSAGSSADAKMDVLFDLKIAGGTPQNLRVRSRSYKGTDEPLPQAASVEPCVAREVQTWSFPELSLHGRAPDAGPIHETTFGFSLYYAWKAVR